MEMRIFQLERVIPPIDVPGRFRPATVDDSDLVAAWSVAFVRESLGDAADPATVERSVVAGIEERRLFVWEDLLPVSMAAWVGPTPNGVRINYVYTPPELRGRGYASACVAALSQNRLDSGRRFCFLYTDLANPTSNSIYRKIGYEPVADVSAFNFSYPPGERDE
jgi:predicted GNAT family acetyltransferase